ncbi:MAG TPA: biotin carboxylase N-terminal domain-containing protein, partial [Actinomycetota bacterium]|nr:biotin carboxylase N-terminal domain-containing protein [Actinomycetota bacterium]
MFSRILIANRGEVAVRVIRACQELGVETVAVYSTADRESLHVELADRAVHIGPPPPSESYLNVASLIAAATTTGCEAVHPGWGFLAESAPFAAACEENDLVFVGPRPETVAAMGDKVRAKETVAAAGVPVVPGSPGTVDLAGARELAARLSFPLLLKAAAGGGGRGMRLVASDEDLERAFQTAAAEAEAAFSNGSLYIEQALVGARHVEIQVLGDGVGGVLTLGERDCSIQRRHQKLIEEAPSPAVSPDLRAEMEAAAATACEALRYRGAGTLEFLLDPDGRFYFIEMNTRLQVEHPVTELLTGVDLARAQLHIAAGDGLARTGRAALSGHAIEIRINAEDPARGFLPAPGTVTRFEPPLGPGVRVDTHVYDGYR